VTYARRDPQVARGIRRVRLERGWTLRDVALLLGCAPSRICRIENGERGTPDPAEAAGKLGVPLPARATAGQANRSLTRRSARPVSAARSSGESCSLRSAAQSSSASPGLTADGPHRRVAGPGHDVVAVHAGGILVLLAGVPAETVVIDGGQRHVPLSRPTAKPSRSITTGWPRSSRRTFPMLASPWMTPGGKVAQLTLTLGPRLGDRRLTLRREPLGPPRR
jgi:hypothetical protein